MNRRYNNQSKMTDYVQSVPRVRRLLPRLRKIRLGVVGDLMLDRYLWGTATKLSPEAAVPVVDFEKEEACLGGAGNVAANVAALGAKVEMFGVVGDDGPGATLRSCLREAEIGDRGTITDKSRMTTVIPRVFDRQQQVVRIEHVLRESLRPEFEESLLRGLFNSLEKLDAVVLSDYDKGLVSDSVADRLLNACQKRHVPVFVKPKTSRHRAYQGAQAVVCNYKDAGFHVLHALLDEKSVEEAGPKLREHFGCSGLVITRGKQGMSIFEESSPKYVTIRATSSEAPYGQVGRVGVDRSAAGRQVFDVTGAGDTVLSVLALAMAAGATLADAALLANVAAGVVVGKLGTASVSPAELALAVDELRR